MELAVQIRGSWDVVLETATWATDRGLAAIALPDHYLERGDALERPAYDNLIHLAGLAARTTSLGLVCLVSPVTFRHPAVFYKTAVTIDRISGGRFTLGVGVGWLTEEFELFGIDFPERKIRYQMLEESLAYLRAALTPEAKPFKGHHYQLGDFDPHPHPINARILVGGGGPRKTPRLAGLYADEFNIYACHPAAYLDRANRARTVATEAGRDASAIYLSSAGPGLAARKEADYRSLLQRYAERSKSSPERIEAVYERDGLPHGSGAKAAEMISALEEAGCQRFYMQMFLGDTRDLDTVLEACRG
jgi:alkanesulfonate monooxygenase SsuD/methylene tetrahydromethanopterin reductase-like flavin-dependent oxidoreductase (luciferase family)